MAKSRKVAQMPVRGGVRRQRGMGPRLNGGDDGTVITYNTSGTVLATAAGVDYIQHSRPYIPGNSTSLVATVGPDLVSNYSSAKFLPGTKIKWEPSVSFNTTGRVFVGFTDNPEVAAAGLALAPAGMPVFIRSLGSVVSFPVWQETEINFPTKLRRKRFDCNITASGVDTFDRSLQTIMFVWVEGMPPSTTAGSFWYHDRVDVEGLHNIVT